MKRFHESLSWNPVAVKRPFVEQRRNDEIGWFVVSPRIMLSGCVTAKCSSPRLRHALGNQVTSPSGPEDHTDAHFRGEKVHQAVAICN